MPGTDTPKLYPDVFRNNKIEVCGDVLQFTLDKSHYISVELGDYQDSAILMNQYYYLKGISNYEDGLFNIA